MIRISLLVTVALLAGGCLDSIVNDPCEARYSLVDGVCVGDPTNAGPMTPARGDRADSPDSPRTPSDNPTAPDGLNPDVCSLATMSCDGACVDAQTSPDHCGTCDNACASGSCTAGVCD